MSDRTPLLKVVEAYEGYETLASRLGFQVNRTAVRDYALDGTGCRVAMKTLFSRSHAESHESRTAPAEIAEAIRKLADDLAETVRQKANGSFPKGVAKGTKKFLDAVAGLPPAERSEIAGAVGQGEQGRFLKRGDVPIGEFHRRLKEYAKGQTIARGRLVKRFQEEAKRHGVSMSQDAIEERMRSNTKVRTAPACFIDIVSELDDSYLTGLIAIEEMTGETPPEEWLEAARQKLGFRSHNALHKAVAETTNLKYEATHKALTRPRKGQRIQIAIKEKLDEWLEKAARGERPVGATLGTSSPRRRPAASAPAGRVRRALGKLLRTYPSRQAFHQAAAGALGVPPSDVEDFFNHSSRRIKFTAEGLRNLERLVKERRKMELRISYLGSEGTRKLADRLAGSANAVYRAWEADPDNLTLKRAYRKMRLQLIHAMKQRWTLSDWEDAEADSETVELDEDALIDDGFLEDE